MALNFWQLATEREHALNKLKEAKRKIDETRERYEKELNEGLNPRSKRAIEYKARLKELKYRIDYWRVSEWKWKNLGNLYF